LIANWDAGIPEYLQGIVQQPKVLRMHPLGAKSEVPASCMHTIVHQTEIEMVTFAVKLRRYSAKNSLWLVKRYLQIDDIPKESRTER
jgi:hypothetical protein